MKKFSICLKGICFSLMLIIVMMLNGCKKDNANNNSNSNPDDNYYISFKADGVQMEFKKGTLAGFPNPDTSGLYSSTLVAYQNIIDVSEPTISLVLFSETNYVNGQNLQDPLKAITTHGLKLPQVLITYVEPGNTDIFQTLGHWTDVVGTPGYWEHAVADAKATITEITTTYVKGTFSGTVFNGSDVNQKRVITEGTFYLKRT